MNEQNDNEIAVRRGNALFGSELTRRVLDELTEWDPGFSRAFQDFVYDSMYDRDVLDQRTRELLAVAACVCQNALPQLRTHAFAAIRVGATVEEVKEAVIQMSVYTGMPYVLQAIRSVNEYRSELETLESQVVSER